MTKKLVYMKFKNVTEKELQEMMDNKFNTLTQRGLDRELEALAGISHRTWGNYKLDTQLGKGVSQQLKINELTTNLNRLTGLCYELIEDKADTVSDTWSVRVSEEKLNEIEEFLDRGEK